MEQSLNEKTEILKRISSIAKEVELVKQDVVELESERYSLLSKRVEKLQEQNKRIDEYVEEIEALIKVAEESLDSRNILSIEAPDDYRVNINRLRSWSKMIDKSSSNDVYAQRVDVVGRCDIAFLNKKKQEFSEQIELLEQEIALEKNNKTESVYNSIMSISKLLNAIVNGDTTEVNDDNQASENEEESAE